MPPSGSGTGRSSNSSGASNDRRITAFMRQQKRDLRARIASEGVLRHALVDMSDGRL